MRLHGVVKEQAGGALQDPVLELEIDGEMDLATALALGRIGEFRTWRSCA